MRQALIVLDTERRIKLRNRQAAELLARRDLVLEREGALACWSADSDRLLLAALHELVTPPVECPQVQGRVLMLRRSGGQTATARLLAMEAEPGETPHVLLTIVESSAVQLDPRVLSETYDLTRTESRLAALIADGRSTQECSNALGVKTSTLRSHLKAIYSKTCAAGKADLVRMMLTACVI